MANLHDLQIEFFTKALDGLLPSTDSGSSSVSQTPCAVSFEENSSLNAGTNSGFQYSLGNGATSENGLTMPFSGTVTYLSFSSNSNCSGTVALYKNSSHSGASMTLTNDNKTFVSCSVDFEAGDKLTFRTISGSGGGRLVPTFFYIKGD